MIDTAFFSNNRHNLANHTKGGVVVLTAYASLQMSGDMEHVFQQESNFWYLTGISEPGWRLILDGSRHSWLVAPDIDEIHRVFNGGLSGEEAKSLSGVDEIVSSKEFESILQRLSRQHTVAYTLGDDPQAAHYDFVLNPAQKELTAVLRRVFRDVHDCRKDIAKMRAIKQPVEIEELRRAIGLTVGVFEEVRQQMTDFKTEYEIDAFFTYRFRQANAIHAYQPIVASGKHACTLHYVKNDSRLKSRQMILMDVGARVNGYAADITRTYAYGAPTKRQTEIYEALRSAQQEIIAVLAPGLPVAEYIAKVDLIMQQKLIDLALISDKNDEKYRTYFPHAISHGLGIDVHDSLGQPKIFEEGMVLTVEPGIYLPDEGIGMRIEDDILITHSGRSNLSKSLSTEL